MAKRLNCICIDSSEHSERAFNWYVNNYHHHGDVVGLLHVHQIPDLPVMGALDYSAEMYSSYEKVIENSLEESKQLLKEYEQKCQDANLEYKIIRADCQTSAGQKICELAKENGASVIILGQRGLNMVRRMLLGSTSDYVLHHAHIPVTVVPKQDRMHSENTH